MLIFAGVVLTNIGEGLHGGATGSLTALLLLGALPCLVAGFCFPIGNQLVWYATRPPSTHRFGGVLLLGTPMPSVMSWIGIAMVSVGIVLFYRMQS